MTNSTPDGIPAWRGHAWIKGGNWKQEFSCVGYDELNKTVREMFEKRNAVEMSFWLSIKGTEGLTVTDVQQNGNAAEPSTWQPDCQMDVEPMKQCCCNCAFHLPVHFHCCTSLTLSAEQKKAAGVEGRCVCGVQKGWACVQPDGGRVYDNWPEHSCGCELYTPKTTGTGGIHGHPQLDEGEGG
jgi:hypothetical protein